MSQKPTPPEQVNESPDPRQLVLPWWDGWLTGKGAGRQSPRSPGDHDASKPGKGRRQ